MSLLERLPSTDMTRLGEAFHHTVVNHFAYIRDNLLFSEEPVDNVYCRVYHGDFHGMLQHLGSPYTNFRCNTEFNGFASSNDYNGEAIVVRLINADFVDQLYNTFITSRR
jgi:hypothetical protein